MMTDLLMSRSAIIKGRYRYRLERQTGTHGRVAAGIIVNPSTADADIDGHTIRKWFGFAQRNEISRFIIGNKFAWRATDVRALATAEDPVGPENGKHLEQIMRDADIHVVAWGPLSKLPRHLRGRWQDVAAIADKVGCRLLCLGTAKDGHPLHPLTLSYDRALVEWRRP